eukprot:Awhi_evm1s2183
MNGNNVVMLNSSSLVSPRDLINNTNTNSKQSLLKSPVKDNNSNNRIDNNQDNKISSNSQGCWQPWVGSETSDIQPAIPFNYCVQSNHNDSSDGNVSMESSFSRSPSLGHALKSPVTRQRSRSVPNVASVFFPSEQPSSSTTTQGVSLPPFFTPPLSPMRFNQEYIFPKYYDMNKVKSENNLVYNQKDPTHTTGHNNYGDRGSNGKPSNYFTNENSNPENIDSNRPAGFNNHLLNNGNNINGDDNSSNSNSNYNLNHFYSKSQQGQRYIIARNNEQQNQFAAAENAPEASNNDFTYEQSQSNDTNPPPPSSLSSSNSNLHQGPSLYQDYLQKNLRNANMTIYESHQFPYREESSLVSHHNLSTSSSGSTKNSDHIFSQSDNTSAKVLNNNTSLLHMHSGYYNGHHRNLNPAYQNSSSFTIGENNENLRNPKDFQTDTIHYSKYETMGNGDDQCGKQISTNDLRLKCKRRSSIGPSTLSEKEKEKLQCQVNFVEEKAFKITRGVTCIQQIINQWEQGDGVNCPPLKDWSVEMR